MEEGGLIKCVDKSETLLCRLYNDSINCKWVRINIIHSSVCYRLIFPLKIGNHRIYDIITLNYHFLIYQDSPPIVIVVTSKVLIYMHTVSICKYIKYFICVQEKRGEIA